MISARWRTAAIFAAVRFASASPVVAQTVDWVAEPGAAAKAVVEVSGLPADEIARIVKREAASWSLQVVAYPVAPDFLPTGNEPPMAGSYSEIGGKLRFTPRFPLDYDVQYIASLARLPVRRPKGDDTPITANIGARFRLPERPPTAPTRVTMIYPESADLPENLLKFYIRFSAPMNSGNVYDRIHLRDPSGKDDRQAFLQIGQELWDPTMTRLTLLLDPGRIKRGVSLNLELGPALEVGKSYSLTIDPEWKDSNGQPLAAGFTKSFRVVAADRTAIDIAQWRVSAPGRGTRDAVAIAFPEPLDHALAMRLIRVVDGKGANVLGEVATAEEDRRWTFRPDASWAAGKYDIVVFTTIEDLAGNNVGKPFDVDVFENVQKELPSETVRIGFEVK